MVRESGKEIPYTHEPSRVQQYADALLIGVAVVILSVVAVGGLLWYVEDHIEDTGVKVIIATVGCFAVLGAVIGVAVLMTWVVRRGLGVVAEQNVGLQNAVVELIRESREGRAEDRRMMAQIFNQVQAQPAPAQLPPPGEDDLEEPHLTQTGPGQWSREGDDTQRRAERLAMQMMVKMYPDIEPTDANIQQVTGEGSGSVIPRAWKIICDNNKGVRGKSGQARRWIVSSPSPAPEERA